MYLYLISEEEIQKAPSIKDFHRKLKQEIKSNKQLKFIIFDIRDNTGGSSRQGTNLIKTLSTFNKFNTKEKFFVLVNHKNYSSATINILDFKQYTNATIVGEPPRGTPNHFGEIMYFYLPNSKIKVYYSTKYFERINSQQENAILPDKRISTSFEDYKKGEDPVLQYVLKKASNLLN